MMSDYNIGFFQYTRTVHLYNGIDTILVNTVITEIFTIYQLTQLIISEI